MSAVNRAIQVFSLAAATPAASNIHPGDVFYDAAGNLGTVVQTTPTTRGLLTLSVASGGFNPPLTFTPGAPGSGVATITGTVQGGNGAVQPNALVTLVLSAIGNLSQTAASGATQVRGRVGDGTPNLLLTILTDAAGAFGVTIAGTTLDFVSVTGLPVSPPGNASLADGQLP